MKLYKVAYFNNSCLRFEYWNKVLIKRVFHLEKRVFLKKKKIST
jgi:hypothetical protein